MKPARWPRLKKWFKRLAFGLIALVTLVALGVAIEGYRAKRAWDACQRELAARGESLDWQAHVPSLASDEQNFLATPLLAACFGFAIEADPSDGRPGWAEACETLARISDWASRLPSPGDWRQGTVVPLTEWQAILRSTEDHRTKPAQRYGAALPGPADEDPMASAAILLKERPDASAVDDLRLLLGLHQAELDEIRAAARRPSAQLSLEPGAALSESFQTRLSRLRSLARPFWISSWTELTAGDPERAVVDIETALALSDAAVSQPLLMNGLVRIAMVELAVQPIWNGLAERRWEDAQLARLIQRLERLNSAADMQRMVRGERVFALTLLSAALSRVDPEPSLGGDDFMAMHRAMRWWPRAILYRNQINIARAYQELLIDPIDPAGPSVQIYESEERQAIRARHHSFSPYNFFTSMLLDAMDQSLDKAVASQVTVTLAKVACALERHRLAHARYPETLDELTPRFLSRIPPDPVNGGPLHYRRDDPDRFVLYSVGLNQQDDGGVPSVPSHGSFGPDAPSGDWVWRSHPVTLP
jgi:hypothetical protein